MQPSTTKLDETRVREIKLRSQGGESNISLSRAFGVSEKTISRIITGKAWGHVKITDLAIFGLDSKLNPAIDEVVRFKYLYGFNVNGPLFWGAYDSYDGVRHVATDGTIAWVGKSLYDTARSYAQQDSPGFPFFSDQACELSTFELADLMDAPFGHIMKAEVEDFGSIVPLKSRGGEVRHIDQKFWALASRLKLHFYEVKNDPGRVFLVKLSVHYETEAGLQASVATMN